MIDEYIEYMQAAMDKLALNEEKWTASRDNDVRPTKTQIKLRIRAIWSESSFSAYRNFVPLAIQNAPSEDSGQTARMRRLIWIFVGRSYLRVDILTLGPKCFYQRISIVYLCVSYEVPVTKQLIRLINSSRCMHVRTVFTVPRIVWTDRPEQTV